MHAQYEQLVKNDVLQYDALLSLYPWLTAKGQNAILSPDADGILCGLLMSHYFNWNIVGFYDGETIALKNSMSVSDCIFLDMDIYREHIRSCGHHMVAYNKNELPTNWGNYSKCINPNIIRGFDALHDFPQKYPFGTIHFLLCVGGFAGHINNNLPDESIPILLYADGTFKNLLNYPENCASWFEFLNIKNSKSPVYSMFVKFANRKMTEMFHGLESIFGKFREIAPKTKKGTPKERNGGDRIPISEINDGSFPVESLERTQKLIGLLAGLTGWNYIPEKWCLTGFQKTVLHKDSDEKLNGLKYSQFVSMNPFSMVIRAAKTIEYALDEDNIFSGSL